MQAVNLMRCPKVHRIHKRATFGQTVQMLNKFGGSQEALIDDLSRGGVSILSEAVFAINEVFSITFPIPSPTLISEEDFRIAVKCQVVYSDKAPLSRKAKTGLQFIGLSDQFEALINRYVSKKIEQGASLSLET